MGRHKERVKLLVSYVVQPELVQPAAEIQIPVLQVPVHVGQLPHVDRLRCLIIPVQALSANVDHRLRALRELQYQHQLTHLLLARYNLKK